MRAVELIATNIFEGIRAFPEPFYHVALGCSPGRRNTRVSLGMQDIESLITKKPYSHPTKPFLHLVTDANILMIDNKKALAEGKAKELVTKPIIVRPTYPNDDRVLVKWGVPSGHNGRANIYVSEEVFLVGLDIAEFTSKQMQVAEVMCVLRPNQSLEASRSGDGLQPGAEKGSLSWDGYILTAQFGAMKTQKRLREDVAPLHTKPTKAKLSA